MFADDVLTCCMCGKLLEARDYNTSGWHGIIVGEFTFYACPQHFPDDAGSAADVQRAYDRVLQHILESHKSVRFVSGN